MSRSTAADDEVLPSWAAEYDDPVVVAKCGTRQFHEIDRTAETPQPSCRYAERDGTPWRIWERETAETWKELCEACQHSE